MWLSNWFKKQEEVPSTSEQRLKILALSMCIDDCVSLRCLAQQHKWDLRITQSPRDAFHLASQSHFEIILCDRNQPGYPWREVVDRLRIPGQATQLRRCAQSLDDRPALASGIAMGEDSKHPN